MSKATKSAKSPARIVSVTVEPAAIEAVQFAPLEVLPAADFSVATVSAAYPNRVITWDEPIVKLPFRNFRNVEIPGRMGVWTEDGVLLGSYAKGESVLPNVELFGNFEEALSSMGVTWERSISCLQGGSEVVARYTIRSVEFNGPDGKPFCARFSVTNSYNGSRKVAAMLELLRLICLNGCVGFRSAIDFSARHSGNLNAKSIVARVAPEIDRGMKQLEQSIGRLAEIKIDDNAGRHLLRNLAMAAPTMKFSRLAARRIETRAWNKPESDETATHNTLFGMLNAGTRFFRDEEAGVKKVVRVNHQIVESDDWEVEPKLEMVERMAPYFNLALIKAADESATFARLTAPVDWETAYGVKEGDE